MRRATIISIGIANALLLASCATPPDRAEENYMRAMREGNYSLILPDRQEDKEKMAVLDVEGDTFELIPEGGERERIGGLSKSAAIIRADKSLEGSGVMLKAVRADGGEIIGYEVYPPTSHGPGSPPGPEAEAVLLPNLLRIDYNVDTSGRSRLRIITLPLSSPDRIVPSP